MVFTINRAKHYDKRPGGVLCILLIYPQFVSNYDHLVVDNCLFQFTLGVPQFVVSIHNITLMIPFFVIAGPPELYRA